MNNTIDYSPAELDQSNFGNFSCSSILKAFFKTTLPESDPRPVVELNIDVHNNDFDTRLDGNIPNLGVIFDDLESGRVDKHKLATEFVTNALDNLLLKIRNARMTDVNFPLFAEMSPETYINLKPENLDLSCKNIHVFASIISTTAHFAAIIALAISTYVGSIGQYGNSSERLFVSLVDPSAIVVQQDRRASIDSAPSCPSIARRSKKEEGKIKNETSNKTQTALSATDKGKDVSSDGPSDINSTNKSDIKFVERDISPSKKTDREDNLNFDSPSMQDSVASLPSEASKEQRSAAPQGEDADKFKKMVMAAIYKVVYYPRDALRLKESGEASVSFTIVSNGSIEGLTVVKHSGSEILDKAVLKIVEKASKKFPTIPKTLGYSKINYVVPITFKKRP
ncbi:MAG: energy transducer TonB [Desulfomonilaceae bacterium]